MVAIGAKQTAPEQWQVFSDGGRTSTGDANERVHVWQLVRAWDITKWYEFDADLALTRRISQCG